MFVEFDWGQVMRESPLMFALVGGSVVLLATAAERLIYFRRRGGDVEGFVREITPMLGGGRMQEAVGRCANFAHPVGAAAGTVLRAVSRGRGDVEEHLHVTLGQQRLLLERNLVVLGSLAAIAPLVGLLGTVWGILRAFRDMGVSGSAAPSVVASGVAEALLTTAAGLIIAVPALLLYNHFSRRTSVALAQAEYGARRLRLAWEGGTSTRPAGDGDQAETLFEASRDLGKAHDISKGHDILDPVR